MDQTGCTEYMYSYKVVHVCARLIDRLRGRSCLQTWIVVAPVPQSHQVSPFITPHVPAFLDCRILVHRRHPVCFWLAVIWIYRHVRRCNIQRLAPDLTPTLRCSAKPLSLAVPAVHPRLTALLSLHLQPCAGTALVLTCVCELANKRTSLIAHPTIVKCNKALSSTPSS